MTLLFFLRQRGNTTRSVTKLITSHVRAPVELRNGARDAPQPQQIAVLWKCRTAGGFLHSLRSCHMYHWLRSTLLFHPSKAVLLGYGGRQTDRSGGSADSGWTCAHVNLLHFNAALTSSSQDEGAETSSCFPGTVFTTAPLCTCSCRFIQTELKVCSEAQTLWQMWSWSLRDAGKPEAKCASNHQDHGEARGTSQLSYIFI